MTADSELLAPLLRLSPPEILARLEAYEAPCHLCEIRCGAMRPQGQQGACGLAESVHVYNRLLHMGEEAPLVPSYAIFMSGCSMSCSFCSEDAHLRPPFIAKATDPVELAGRVARDLGRARVKIHNLNFVGGEPSLALPWITRVVVALDELVEKRPPILLNTNGYLTPEALALATQLCEIFLVDFKFGQDRCAQSIANVDEYSAVLRRNLSWLADPLKVPVSLGEVVAPTELWVRHLLMPGHLECCTKPCLEWLAENTPEAHVNLMPAFYPFRGEGNDTWGNLSDEERERGREMLVQSGIRLAYYDGRRLS